MLAWFVGVLIDAQTKRDISALRRSTDNHFARPCAQMHRSFVARREEPGRLDHNLNTELLPWQLRRVALGEYSKRVAVEHNLITLGLNGMRQHAMHRVILEKMGEGGGIGDVVDGNYLQILLMQRRPKEHAANAAKAVNRN